MRFHLVGARFNEKLYGGTMLPLIIGVFLGSTIGLFAALFCLSSAKYLDCSIQSSDPEQIKSATDVTCSIHPSGMCLPYL